MDPRLRTVALVLVAAAVGAVVAGGAITYVNGSSSPATTLTPLSSESRASEASRDGEGSQGESAVNADARREDSDESAASAAPSDPPRVRERSSDEDGPSATITSDATPAKPRTPTKTPPPVVEESGDAPKITEEGDGGSVRESAKDATKDGAKDNDGGSVR